MGTFNNGKAQFTELLFENRNKNYGAYAMRRSYDRRLLVSTGITVSVLLMAIIMPKLFGNSQLVTVDDPTKRKVVITEVNLTPKEEKKKEVVEQKKVEPTQQPKGQKSALPVTPMDTTKKVADADTVKYDPFAKTGDPKGKDTTTVMAFNTGGNDTGTVKKKKEIVNVAEVNPEFPGGMAALYKFLKDNIKYPPIARENEISGTVYMSFVVGEDGSISDVQNLNKVAGGLDKEAIRVVSMMPKWKPGMMGHETVPVRYNIPVKFVWNPH
jgi:protein TonB